MNAILKLGLIFVFAFGGVFFTAQKDVSAVSETAMNYSNSSASRSLYLNNCARCHGGDGRAQTESGRLYDVPDISGGRLRRASNTRLTNIIRKGAGSMPAFGKKLTKAQIASLVSYVRTL